MGMSFGSFASRVVATKVVAKDGTGDFTDIQSAINALPAGGGVVYVKEGTYSLSTAVSITSDNISLIGAGKSTLIKNTTNVETIVSVSGDNCIINNIYFQGFGLGAAASASLVCSGLRNLISQCFFDDARIGLRITGADSVAIQNIFELGAGILAVGIQTTAGGRAVISGNTITGATTAGIQMNGPANCVASNNILRDCVTGIHVRGSSDNTVINGNSIINSTTQGIKIGSAAEGTSEAGIVGNVITGGTDGVVITHANNDKCLIASNVITGYSNIAINDSGTGTVTGNNVT